MKNLKEKQFLVNMALSLGQTPDPALVKELEEHKKIMDTVTPMGEEFGSLIAQLKQLKDEVDTIRTTVEVKQQYFPEEPKEFPKPPTLDELMASLPVEEVAESIIEEPTTEVDIENPLIKLASEHITKESKIEEDSYQQPDTPLVKSLDDIRKKIKFLEGWISKISMAGPGGGEVNLLKLDDVDTSAIGDGKVLAYNAANAKIEFQTSSGGGGAVNSVNGLTGTIVLTTANISEDTNLYFTNSKVVAALTAGQSITIDANGRINSTATGGSNSSYTDSNTYANVSLIGFASDANVNLKANIVDLTTTNVVELTNLYFTNARAVSAVTNTTLSNITVSGNVVTTGTGGDLIMTGGAITGVGNITSNGIVAINAAGGITTDQSSFDIVNGTATTVSIAGAATALNFGATSGTATFNNPTIVGTQTTQNVFNTVTTFANIFGTASTLTIGATSGTMRLRNPTIVGTQATQTLFNTVATTINFAGAATTLSIGAATGNTTINNGLFVTGNLYNVNTSNIAETTNLYYTNARVYSNVTALGYITSTALSGYATNTQIASYALTTSLTTDNVTELTNLYFTNVRARTAVSAGTGVNYDNSTGVISIGQNVDDHSSVTFANVTITGNLLVQGNSIIFDSNTLVITDPLIQVGKNPVGDSVDLGFFGHYLDGSNNERHAGLFRDASDGQFKLFANLFPEPATVVSTPDVSYESANLVLNYVVGKVTDITNHTTTGLSEGTNLYHTNSRVYSNVIQLGYITNSALSGYATNTQLSLYATNTQLESYATTANLNLKANIVDLTTANVVEINSFQYFTNARVYANVTSIGYIREVANTAPITTSNTLGVVTIGLRTSGVSAATYGNATIVPIITVDTFGRITSASNATIIAGITTITNTSPIGATTTGSTTALSHLNSGVTANTYGGINRVPVITVNATGHITSSSNVAIAPRALAILGWLNS